jgi:hypothetical protein
VRLEAQRAEQRVERALALDPRRIGQHICAAAAQVGKPGRVGALELVRKVVGDLGPERPLRNV